MRYLNRIAAVLASVFLVLGLIVAPTMQLPKAQAQTQPSIADECGASVAIAVDLSNSLTATDLSNLKTALRELINSLAGAPYTIGLYTFASTAPAYGDGNRSITGLSLMDEANVKTLLNRVDSIYLPGGQYGGTNWQGGLQAVAKDMATAKYDTVYFITDGVPTFDKAGWNYAGNTTELAEINKAIEQKRSIEDAGGKIIPVGVGDAITNNNSQPIRDLRWFSNYWSSWQEWVTVEYRTPKRMLNDIATTSGSSIIVDKYANLPKQLASNFVTGCMFVNKQIVDADGNMIERGAGWTFDVVLQGSATRQTLTTDNAGSALTAIGKGETSPRVTITERAQTGFDLSKVECQQYQPGGGRTDVPVTRNGLSVDVALDPAKITSCTFSNLPSVPMYVGKKVVSKDPVIEQKLGGALFDFSYECTVPGKSPVAGQFLGLKNGERQKIGDLPLDATCKITETNRQEFPRLYEIATTWESENATEVSTSADGLTYEVKPSVDAYRTKGPAAATAVNTYTPKTATITLNKAITGDAPDSMLPDAFPVRYSCRYVPMSEDRPEAGSTINPANVGSGTVLVPRTGEVEIGPFPIGTQCSLFEEGDGSTNFLIPGFDLTTTWASDLCDWDATPGNPKTCEKNYIWLDPEKTSTGNYQVTAQNHYEHEPGRLKIVKKLTGDAAEVAAGETFKFDVTCDLGGEQVFAESGIQILGGQSTTIEDVHVGATCTVVEQTPDSIDGVNITAAAPTTAVIKPENEEVAVAEMVNEFNYQKGPISLTKLVDVTDVVDPLRAADMEAENYPITVTCYQPGDTQPVVLNKTISHNQTLELGEFPVGTQCAVQEKFEEPEDLDFYSQLSPAQITLSSEAGASATLTNTFTTPDGDLVVMKKVGSITEGLSDVAELIPHQFDFTLDCVGQPTQTFTLFDSEVKRIEGIPVGTSCTLTEHEADVPELERETTLEGMLGTIQGESMVFEMPEIGVGATVDVNNVYRPKYEKLSVAKQATVAYADGRELPGDVRAAMLDEQDFEFSYRCTRSGEVIASSTFTLKNGATTEFDVPVNSECVVTESELEILGADGPTVTATGDGVFDEAANSVSFGPAQLPQRTKFTNAYEVATGAFNLKKKVEGDGVATIPRERDFDFHYRCEFNGALVAEDDYQIGRFDTGSDYTIADLPIGTKCTVTENLDTSQEENAELELRWTLSDDTEGRGLERPCVGLENCTQGTDSATLTIRHEGEDNHQGTLIAWNKYTYDRVNLKLAKELTGDGPVIAAKDSFQMQLVCVDSRNQGFEFAPGQEVREIVTITGAGEVLLDNPIIAGWDCTLTELPVNQYDAEVTASFKGAELASDSGAFAENPEGISATFKMLADGQTEQTVTVVNDYQRRLAKLQLSKELIGNQLGNVNEYLTSKVFPISYKCEDAIAGETLTGKIDVTAGDVVEVEAKIPASATCTFSEDDSGKIPAGFEDVVNTYNSVVVETGDTVTGSLAGVEEIAGISLSADDTTKVTFKNSYWVFTGYFGIEKEIEGDPNNEIFPAGTEFEFTYECEIANLLPGQQATPLPGGTVNGNKITGSFKLQRGHNLAGGPLPIGSSCKVKESDLPPDLAAKLEEKNLRMQANYVHQDELTWEEPPQPVDPEDPHLTPGQALEDRLHGHERLPLTPEGEIPFDDENGHYALVVNSLYRADGEVVVKKVNPDGEPLEGAKFAIYPASADGKLGAEPLVADLEYRTDTDLAEFAVKLKPGSYYLVETRSGTGSELLPRPWRFNVEATNSADLLADLEFKLSPHAENSGLVTIQQPTEDEPVWVIQVANVEAGDLPKTGSEWMPRVYGFAVLLLLVAGSIYLRPRRQ